MNPAIIGTGYVGLTVGTCFPKDAKGFINISRRQAQT